MRWIEACRELTAAIQLRYDWYSEVFLRSMKKTNLSSEWKLIDPAPRSRSTSCQRPGSSTPFTAVRTSPGSTARAGFWALNAARRSPRTTASTCAPVRGLGAAQGGKEPAEKVLQTETRANGSFRRTRRTDRKSRHPASKRPRLKLLSC